MFGYIAQRLVGAVSVLFVVSVVSFGLYALTPGDPAVVMAGTRECSIVPDRVFSQYNVKFS